MKIWGLLVLSTLVCQLGCDKLPFGSDDSKKKVSKEDRDSDEEEEEEEEEEDEEPKKKKKKKSAASDEEPEGDDEDGDKEEAKDEPPPGVAFAGVYRSTWGDTTMRQEGTKVSATYPGGVLTCQSDQESLDCDWKEGSLVGKAKLKKQANGDLDGTWGNGASATDGGRWLFRLLSAGDPGPSDTDAKAGSFAGVYVSTWGDTVFTEEGDQVKGTYPGGKLECTASGAELDCTWREGSATGKARLTRQLSGNIQGTWGNGASATNGGSWLFRKKG